MKANPELIRRMLDNGLTQRLLRAAGLDLVERDYTVAELKAADEVFLTGTSTEVMPVVRVDDTTIGTGEPGPLSRRLRLMMLEHAEQCSR